MASDSWYNEKILTLINMFKEPVHGIENERKMGEKLIELCEELNGVLKEEKLKDIEKLMDKIKKERIELLASIDVTDNPEERRSIQVKIVYIDNEIKVLQNSYSRRK